MRGSAFVALAAVLALAGCQKASDEAFGKRVHAYLMAHPEVIREAVQKLQEKDQLAAATASTQAIAKHRAELERDPRDFVANPDGRITVVEFFDYRCGYCKMTAPQVLQLIKANPDVRFVFKEWPIFGGVSVAAARAALTPAGKSKGVELYAALMGERALDDAALDRRLADLGLDPKAVRAQSESETISRQIADVDALRRALGIEGTPAFVIGDTLIPGADMGALHAALAQAKAAALKKS